MTTEVNREEASSTGAAPPELEFVEASIPSMHDPGRTVLTGVNWRVVKGEFWAIAGLARSGKTNLMMVAAGVARPVWGIQRLFGRELTAGRAEHLEERLKVGLVFDGGQLLQHLTLAENVALPLEYHGTDATGEATARRMLELVKFTGLETWAAARPAAVNRNWQQRFGLARALALKPEVLLLDSPLSGLDPRDAGWWLETLGSLAAGHPIVDGRPLTLVVTGDDLRPWRRRASRFGAVSDGSFIDLGDRAELESNSAPWVREWLLSSGKDS